MTKEARYFEGVIQDGKIFERKYGRESQQIGVTQDVFERLVEDRNELKDGYEQCKELLIKHGLIRVPMSTEEQIQKLLDISEQQADRVNILTSQFHTLAERIDTLMESLDHEHIDSPEHSENGGPVEPGNQGSGPGNRVHNKKPRNMGR